MEKTKHFFENSVYHVSNHSVARNGMFLNEDLQSFFIDRLEYYLSPITEILAYDISKNGFQLLVKLKDRTAFEDHFNRKRKLKEHSISGVPESTYIFSQAMANLQVSFVKHFNYNQNRSGTLMAARFTRELIETESEMESRIKILNRNEKIHQYHKKWISQMESSKVFLNSSWIYGGTNLQFRRTHIVYKNAHELDLGGIFSNLPPKALPSSKSYFLNKTNLLFGP